MLKKMNSLAELSKDIDLTSDPWNLGDPVQLQAVYFETLPSYNDFFQNIFLKNQLCILGPSCTSDWLSRKLWVKPDETPNFHFLKKHFGKSTAPVTRCDSDAKGSSTKTEMTVFSFIEYWENYRAEGYPLTQECLYLKDWHFARHFPNFLAYTPPSLVCSDWLNEFWDVREDETVDDDYRFVYMGPKNSWTPFHSDVLRSYSWSANICGRKKWIFFPPGDEDKLRDRYGQLVHDLRDPTLEDSDKFPHAQEVMNNRIEVIQEPGEIVFVPSGWHHQVFNLEDTISINHNWMNGAGIHLTSGFLSSQMEKVKNEIADCRDMSGFDLQCQMILKADSGMDFVEFYNFVSTIARHRINALNAYSQHYSQLQDQTDVTQPVNLCLLSAAKVIWKSKQRESPEQESDVPNNSNIVFYKDNSIPKVTSDLHAVSSINLPSPLSSESTPHSPLPNNNVPRLVSIDSLASLISAASPSDGQSLSFPPPTDTDIDSISPIPSLKQLALSSISSTNKFIPSRSSSYTSPYLTRTTVQSFNMKSISYLSGSSSSDTSSVSPIPESSTSSSKPHHFLSSLSSVSGVTMSKLNKTEQEYLLQFSTPLQPIQSMSDTRLSRKLSQPVTFDTSVSSPPTTPFVRKYLTGSILTTPSVPPSSMTSLTNLSSPFPQKTSSMFVFNSLSDQSLPSTPIGSSTSLIDFPKKSTSVSIASFSKTSLPNSMMLNAQSPSSSSPKEVQQQISTATSETKTAPFNHFHCPHWAHCGPRLAVWDLQRIKAVILNLRQLPDWVLVLSHKENRQKLIESEQNLLDSLQHCIEEYNSLL